LLVVVIGFVSSSPAPGDNTRRNAILLSDNSVALNPLDQLSSADIAVQVARLVELDESVAVVNHADSVNAQLTVAPVEESVISKPQIVQTDLKSKYDIQVYKVKSGDSISSLAKKFGVTKDSIRWSNGILGESLSTGAVLRIPPVNGIVYKVKSGDTVQSLAERYSSSKQKLTSMNDAELGLIVNDYIIIPDGVRPVPRTYVSFSAFGTARYGGNGYDYGWCTWHAANRRIAAGKPLPTNLGNANTWYGRAAGLGMSVGTQPRVGAVIWHRPGYQSGFLGHVGYVESVKADGSIVVSDMNFPIWGRATTRIIPARLMDNFRFIY
jgi:N-acetylmuramoyl-L-alanine amidase